MRYVCVAIAVLLLTAGVASAGTVFDFEATPSGATPTDNTNLSAPYSTTGLSVRFFFDVNGNNAFDTGDSLPVFEAAGSSDTVRGFLGSAGDDAADSGFESQLGDFFLRQPPPGSFGVSIPGPFLIDYDTTSTISALSGEIWDIDGSNSTTTGTERWLVEVLDGSGSVLASLNSPLGEKLSATAPLDGRPWVFSFTNLPSGVDKVRLSFTGSKTSGIGLAFNNFSPTTSAVVPLPSSFAMALAGGILLGLARLRRRRREA